MYLLLWNDEMYLYDFRIVRYIVLLEAYIFMFFYVFSFLVVVDLVIIEGKIFQIGNLVEMLLALIIGELLMYYFPTALINTIIILKELTLN